MPSYYCDSRMCIKCANISESVYKFISGNLTLTWLCPKTCAEKAMKCLWENREIETRYASSLESFEKKIMEKFTVICSKASSLMQLTYKKNPAQHCQLRNLQAH